MSICVFHDHLPRARSGTIPLLYICPHQCHRPLWSAGRLRGRCTHRDFWFETSTFNRLTWGRSGGGPGRRCRTRSWRRPWPPTTRCKVGARGWCQKTRGKSINNQSVSLDPRTPKSRHEYSCFHGHLLRARSRVIPLLVHLPFTAARAASIRVRAGREAGARTQRFPSSETNGTS